MPEPNTKQPNRMDPVCGVLTVVLLCGLAQLYAMSFDLPTEGRGKYSAVMAAYLLLIALFMWFTADRRPWPRTRSILTSLVVVLCLLLGVDRLIEHFVSQDPAVTGLIFP